MDGVCLLYHSALTAIYAYSAYVDCMVVPPLPGDADIGGKFKFLTFWNLCIQTTFFVVCLINDVAGSNQPPNSDPKTKSRFQRWRDNIFATVAVPVGMFVEMTFWGLYFVDRELVYPKALDKIFPSWLNHVMHTTVALFLLIESYISYHQFPSRRIGMLTLICFASLYLTWIFWIAYYADFWVYPILEVLNAGERTIFILFCLTLFISNYILGEAWNKFLWRKEIRDSKKKPS